MTESADEWQVICVAFASFSRHIEKSRTTNINAASLRDEARQVAQQYFRQGRPILLRFNLIEQMDGLDTSFKNIIELSAHSNATSSYKKQIKIIRKILPRVASLVEIALNSETNHTNHSNEDQQIMQTLADLVPSASLSYKQAIIDLADEARLSFRGPALELRETLREVLDHLAPDKSVMAADGYAPEKDRFGPTMKQKVRFILKARGQSRSSSIVPEQATATIDEMVGNLTRSVYDRSSVATHVAQERKSVIQIRRYVVAVLSHILEL